MSFSSLYQSLYSTILSELTYFNLATFFAVFASPPRRIT